MNLDNYYLILVIVGLVLIVVGIVFFMLGKTGKGVNKVDAFGIKIDIANPSVLLIVSGIILVVLPAVLDKPKPAQESTTAALPNTKAQDEAPQPGRQDSNKVIVPDKTEPEQPGSKVIAAKVDKPDVPIKPKAAATKAPPGKTTPLTKVVKPVIEKKPPVAPRPVVQQKAPSVPVAKLQQAKKKEPLPLIVVAGYVELDSEAEDNNETVETLNRKMLGLLSEHIKRVVGNKAKITIINDQQRGKKLATDSRGLVNNKALCNQHQASALVNVSMEVTIVDETSSAGWPELFMFQYSCGQNRRVLGEYSMEPKQNERFVYSVSMEDSFSDFLNRYGSRLTK